mmetsp:Transcript_46258/g.121319  ORF Transcript_46258/g.121319 Transcript_46258/m.121319 type:complete len:228 (-) Transcript_46258:434-1117(-)
MRHRVRSARCDDRQFVCTRCGPRSNRDGGPVVPSILWQPRTRGVAGRDHVVHLPERVHDGALPRAALGGRRRRVLCEQRRRDHAQRRGDRLRSRRVRVLSGDVAHLLFSSARAQRLRAGAHLRPPSPRARLARRARMVGGERAVHAAAHRRGSSGGLAAGEPRDAAHAVDCEGDSHDAQGPGGHVRGPTRRHAARGASERRRARRGRRRRARARRAAGQGRGPQRCV